MFFWYWSHEFNLHLAPPGTFPLSTSIFLATRLLLTNGPHFSNHNKISL